MREWLQRLFGLGRTTPEDPYRRIVYVPQAQAGLRVDHDTAMRLSSVFAAVRVISETIGALSWHVARLTPTGRREPQPNHQVQRILNRRWNPEISSMSGRETILAHAMTWGNGYAEIERDMAGRAIALWPIPPDRVDVKRVEGTGELVYEVHNQRGARTVLFPDEMFHVHGLGFDGAVGYSVISYAARSIGLGMATEQFGASFFGNDATLGTVLTTPGTLKEEAISRIRNQWNEERSGPQNAWRPIVLEQDMKVSHLGVPANDAQFLETRNFQVEDIARWFRVPPHKIGHLERATFSNIEHQSIEFVTDTLMPWIVRLELEANAKLFGGNNRGSMFTKINVNSLLRGDSAARAAWYKEMAALGVYSINEIRAFEDADPIANGDNRIVPMNMTTLERLIDPPEPPAPRPVDDEEDDEEDDDTMAALVRRMFVDSLERGRAREQKRLHDATQRYLANRDEFLAWREQFYSQHADYLRAQLEAGVTAFAEAVGCDPEGFGDIVSLHVERVVHEAKQAALRYYDDAEAIDVDVQQHAAALLEHIIEVRPCPSS